MTYTHALDRRSAVKLTAGAALAAVAGPYIFLTGSAFAEDGEGADDGGAAVGQVGFLVKPHNCINCQACVEACRKFNKIPKEEPAWRKVTKYAKGEKEAMFVSTSCMHCADPACATVCPAGAITKGDAGIVSVDEERCIGCKYCYQACPFSVPKYNDVSMVKCDCCLSNGVKPGKEVHCAEACNFGALYYGTLDELLEKAPDAQIVDASTAPSFYLA